MSRLDPPRIECGQCSLRGRGGRCSESTSAPRRRPSCENAELSTVIAFPSSRKRSASSHRGRPCGGRPFLLDGPTTGDRMNDTICPAGFAHQGRASRWLCMKESGRHGGTQVRSLHSWFVKSLSCGLSGNFTQQSELLRQPESPRSQGGDCARPQTEQLQRHLRRLRKSAG